MRKKIYLHIGTHKTGSTAVQAFAARHSDELQRRGLLYPTAGRPALERLASGHHLLPWTRMEHVNWKPAWGDRASDPQRVWDDLIDEIEKSSCSAVLISSEEFDVLDDEGAAFVAEKLAGHDVHVLCYLRRLDEFVQSYYTTDVLYHGESRDIQAYAKGMRTTIDYFELIDRWRRLFGTPNVHVGFYARPALDNGDIVAGVFGKTGLDVSRIAPAAKSRFVNWGTVSPDSLEKIRRLNARGASPVRVKAEVLWARLLSSLLGRKNIPALDETSREKLIRYGLERIRLIEAEAFTPSVEAEFTGR